MRVLFASANFGEQVVGGAQLSVRLVAEQLVAQGHEVAVVFVDPTGERTARTASGIHTFKVPAHNVYWHRAPRPGFARRLVWHGVDRFADRLLEPLGEVLDAFRPDVLHSNVLSGLTVGVWKAAERRAIPIVHTVHDYYLLCVNSGMRKDGMNCARPCTSCRGFSLPSQHAARLVSGVIYVSEHMKAVHERERVFAHDAFVTEIIGSYERKTPIARAPYRGPLRLGYLGRLAPDKGLDDLLAELRTLDATDYSLSIAGAGAPAYEAALRRAAQGMPVTFLGRVEPDAFFDAIDVLIVPSLWNEPAGRVVFESGLSQVPVVVAARGGLPQMVGYGERGWTYEPGRRGELARIVAQLAREPAASAQKVERWAALAHEFTPAHVAQQTLCAYEHARAVRTRRAAAS
jgi:glycosyltransferase involved in cell wall biosynthesis